MNEKLHRYRRRVVAAALAASLLLACWYVYPTVDFGGSYVHRRSGAVYLFRDGQFYENGKHLGSYSISLRYVEIDLRNVNEPVYARIGWNRVTMPIPKYGNSELVRQRSAKT